MRILTPLTTMTILALSFTPVLAAKMSPAKVEKTSTGTVLANKAGMTLYTFSKDKADKSECVGKCAAAWPPFAAPASARSRGKWSVVSRLNGKKQWAYGGKPLYTFVKNKKPGQDKGNGIVHFGGTWKVARPSRS